MRNRLLKLFHPDRPFLALMRPGLAGLTDEEYLWEPVPDCWSIRPDSEAADVWTVDIAYPDPEPSPFTTIAWRMAHMTGSVLIAAAAVRGRRLPSGHLDETWDVLQTLPHTAVGAVERWDGAIDLLRGFLANATDDDLGRVESHEWATWDDHPDSVAEQVEFFGFFEPASHGAEIRLVRDLYRHTRGGDIPLRSAASRHGAINIRTAHGSETEERTRRFLLDLLDRHDTRPWHFTTDVVIDDDAIPHSHPVLTLSPRVPNRSLTGLLSVFLHEQLHWYLGTKEHATFEAIADMRSVFPDVPDHDGGGASDDHSTYLHLVLNWLEAMSLAQLVGETDAWRLVAAMADGPVYGWIYRQLIERGDEIAIVVRAHGLDEVLTGGRRP